MHLTVQAFRINKKLTKSCTKANNEHLSKLITLKVENNCDSIFPPQGNNSHLLSCNELKIFYLKLTRFSSGNTRFFKKYIITKSDH
jgi:hypothetical protein